MMTRRFAAICIAATASGFPLAAATAQQDRSGNSLAAQALAQINAFRASHGLPRVRLDAAVARAARAQSEAMASQGVFSHEAGGDFRARLSSNGVGRTTAVENIAWNTRTVTETIELWRNSSPHEQNMRAPDVTRMGIAVARGANGLYWTLVMAGNAR